MALIVARAELEIVVAARLAPGDAGGTLRVEAGLCRFAQHPPHFAAHLPGQLALGQFFRAQFVVRAVVVAGKRPFAPFAGPAAAKPAPAAQRSVAALAVVAVVAVMPMPAFVARLGVERPMAVVAVAMLVPAAHFNVAAVAAVAMRAVPPLFHFAARLGVERPPAVRPSAAPFVNDNRNFGQNMHLTCMWPGVVPGLATRPRAASVWFLPSSVCVFWY